MYFNIIDGRKHEPKAFTNANLSSISNATIKIVDWGRFDRIQVDLPDHDWFQYLRVNGRADEIEAWPKCS